MNIINFRENIFTSESKDDFETVAVYTVSSEVMLQNIFVSII